MACGILIPQPGLEPTPSAVKMQSPNLWTREFLQPQLLTIIYKEYIWKINIFLFMFTQIFFFNQQEKKKKRIMNNWVV